MLDTNHYAHFACRACWIWRWWTQTHSLPLFPTLCGMLKVMSVKTYLAVSMPSRILSSDRTSLMGFLSGSTGGIFSSLWACSLALWVAYNTNRNTLTRLTLQGCNLPNEMFRMTDKLSALPCVCVCPYLLQLCICHKFVCGGLQLLFDGSEHLLQVQACDSG